MPKLTDKQERFCEEYMVDLNATQAAIRAGYSEKTARQIGEQNLSKLDIQNRISELKKNASQKSEITRERIEAELAKIAFFDIRKIFNENNTLQDIKSIDDDSAAAISGIDIEGMYDQNGILLGKSQKIKTNDKIRALESLKKMFGYDAPSKIEHSGGLNIIFEEVEDDGSED